MVWRNHTRTDDTRELVIGSLSRPVQHRCTKNDHNQIKVLFQSKRKEDGRRRKRDVIKYRKRMGLVGREPSHVTLKNTVETTRDEWLTRLVRQSKQPKNKLLEINQNCVSTREFLKNDLKLLPRADAVEEEGWRGAAALSQGRRKRLESA